MTTYVTMIVDESGSMGNIRESAISMFNAQLKALKKAAKKNQGETRVTLISFSDKHKVLFSDVPVEKIALLQDHDYLPSGGTALYDTIAFAVNKQLSEHTLLEDDAVLFVIITDGEENASELHSGGYGLNYVKGMVDAVKATGQWTIAFMGTEDALSEAKAFDISTGNSYTWTANATSINRAVTDSVASIDTYYGARNLGLSSVSNFFSQDAPLANSVTVAADTTTTKTTDEVLSEVYTS